MISSIQLTQCVCQMTALKLLYILCCSAKNTLPTELCSLAKVLPFVRLIELTVICRTMKNCSLFYFMAMMPSMKLQISAFSWQKHQLYKHIYSVIHLFTLHLCIYVFIYSLYFLCIGFIQIGIKTHVHRAYKSIFFYLIQFQSNVLECVWGTMQYI